MVLVPFNALDEPHACAYNSPQCAILYHKATPLYFEVGSFAALPTSVTSGTFQFSVSANSNINLRMISSVSALDPLVQLFSPDGIKLCSAYSYGAVAEIATCVLPFDGDYTVLATSLGGGVGQYALALTCLNGTCGAVTPPYEFVFLPLVRK